MKHYQDDILEDKEIEDYKYFRENYKSLLKQFKFEFRGEVHFSQVDAFNVVHNIAYLYWLEWARTQYLFEIGLPKTDDLFRRDFPLMTVNSNINYFNSLKFTDTFRVLTKISKVGFSSIKFFNIILDKDEKLILKAHSTLVYVNKDTMSAIELPKIVADSVARYEGYTT